MDEWKIGDICYIIANKAKGYVYPYKIRSISEKGYYHIQSETTGMRHNVSPSRMFHSKEEALQSLGFPAHAEQENELETTQVISSQESLTGPVMGM